MEYGILSLIVSADNQACGVVMNIRLHMISDYHQCGFDAIGLKMFFLVVLRRWFMLYNICLSSGAAGEFFLIV